MSIGRVIGLLVLVVVLYAVITQPQTSASMTREGASSLMDAGDSVTSFMTSLVGNDTSTSSSNSSDSTGSSDSSTSTTTNRYPHGGVETGDGSTPN